jgi:site-specific recombinase XerD
MAKKKTIEELVEQNFATANEDNKFLMEEYLDNSTHLSEQSVEQYRSALKIFLSYVNKMCKNKHITEIKSLDFLKYQNWLLNQGLYGSAIKLKRSAISNLNNHIILFHGDDYPTFRNFITQAIKVPDTGKAKEKEPLTDAEYDKICQELEKRELWQKLAYFKFTYATGCRRNESAQLLKEVVNYPCLEKTIKLKDENGVEKEIALKKYKSNIVKCKGRKSDPRTLRKLSFDEDTMQALKKWVEARGEDDCEYMFIYKTGGKPKQISPGAFNEWVKSFGTYVGRPVHPHLIRSSRATSLKKSGKSIESIQQLLGHKSSETTKIYIVEDDEDGEDEIFV